MEEGYKPSLKPALDEYPIDYEKLQKANRDKVVKRIKQELNITKVSNLSPHRSIADDIN